MSDDYHSDLKLDKHNLDKNAEEQAELFDKWGKKAALAKLKMKQAEQAYKVAVAKAEKVIRADAVSYGWTAAKEVTDSFIKTHRRLDPDVQEAKEEWLLAEYEFEQLDIAKWAMSQRGYAISNLTDLYNGSYFSTSYSARRRQIDQQIEEHTKRTETPTPAVPALRRPVR